MSCQTSVPPGRRSESESHSDVFDSLQPPGLYSPWDSPGQNTGLVAFPFSRGSSPPRDRTYVSTSSVLQADSLPAEPLGKPRQPLEPSAAGDPGAALQSLSLSVPQWFNCSRRPDPSVWVWLLLQTGAARASRCWPPSLTAPPTPHVCSRGPTPPATLKPPWGTTYEPALAQSSRRMTSVPVPSCSCGSSLYFLSHQKNSAFHSYVSNTTAWLPGERVGSSQIN